MKEGISESESLDEVRRKARERIMKTAEKLSDADHIIAVESETPDTITLSLSVIDPKGKTVKTYHKGFMKTLNLPNGPIEEVVEYQIRFPERDVESGFKGFSGEEN